MNLPVQALSGNIMQYLENAHPEFLNELNDEVTYQGLQRAIVYDDRQQPLNGIAEINDDHQITVYENYMAFLWCLSFAMVTFYRERESDTSSATNLNLNKAIALLDYAYSLKNKWSTWPNNLPNPTIVSDDYVGEANGITVIAMSYILAHEIGHHTLGHDLSNAPSDIEEAKQEELSADKYAFDTLIKGWEDNNIAKNNSINIAIIAGLSSILLLKQTWSGGNTHPDSDERLQKTLQYLEDSNRGNEEFWSWGILTLLLWNLVYHKENYNPLGNGSAKADFKAFVKYLKGRQ